MSDKTRNAFQQALAETDPINLIHSTQNINADALTDKSVQQTPSFSNSKAASSEIAAYKNSSMIGKPNIHIEEIIPVNTDMIQLHEKFLHNQAEYTRVFSQLVQSQINLISDISISPDKLDKISPLLDQLGKHFEKLSELQTASLNAHIQFFKKQNETQLVSKHPEIKEAGEIETYPSILPGEESSPPTSEPDKSLSKTMPANENAKKGNGHHKSSSSISKENSSNIDENVNPDDITYKIKEIVSEKTGYPPEMLEPDMDMESDLGIDSIKRVEIISALREKYPDMPKIETEQFSEIRSLKHIIDFIIVNTLPGKTKISSQSTKIELPQQIQPDIPALPIVDNDSTKNIMDTMIGIVSEKTGYPVEMLELDMDMESDLGIDSIKRVEIIAALREQYPQLPKIEAEQFAELRTLQQICDFLNESTTKKVLAEPNTLYDIESLITPESVFKAEQVILTTLPAPDWLEFNIPDNHICLITDDGTNLTPQLAEEMSERFGKVIVLSFPQTIVDSQMPLSKNISRYILENMKEGHLQEQIMNILSKHGQIAVFIHLNPRNDMQNDEDINFSEKQKQITKHVFLLAKHLKETLSTVAYNSRSAFMTITHLDGLLGLGENPDFEPVEGGLFGLVKTLNLEWDTVFCRAVDLSPDLDDETSILNILAELHDANLCLTEVGYNRQGRFTLGINSGIEKEGIS